jgi:hypothetical protein
MMFTPKTKVRMVFEPDGEGFLVTCQQTGRVYGWGETPQEALDVFCSSLEEFAHDLKTEPKITEGLWREKKRLSMLFVLDM